MLYRSNTLFIAASVIQAQLLVSGKDDRNGCIRLSVFFFIRYSWSPLNLRLPTNAAAKGQHHEADQEMAEDHGKEQDKYDKDHMESLAQG